MNITNRLATPGEQGLYGTGQGIVLGVQVTDMNVFLGIILGVFVGVMVNKFGNIKLHKYLSPYSGTKSAYILIIFGTFIFSIGISYFWPVVNHIIESLVEASTKTGSFSFFIYGFLNRLLLPTGLHHLLWMPLFYTPLGGTAEIAGQVYNGAFNIWLAELGNAEQISTMHSSIGYLANIGTISLPFGIACAIWKTAKPENKRKVIAVLAPAVTTAFLAGITEPIEFLFLFLSPVLWVAHAFVYGLSLLISNLAEIYIQFDTGINMLINSFAFPMRLGNQYMIPFVFIITALIEYFVFKTLIIKLNIPIIGREEMEQKQDDSIFYNSNTAENLGGCSIAPQIKNIIHGLGGKENILNINNCYSRLRVDVVDENKVDLVFLHNKTQALGIVNKGKHIQIIIGVGVQEVREKIEDCLKHMTIN